MQLTRDLGCLRQTNYAVLRTMVTSFERTQTSTYRVLTLPNKEQKEKDNGSSLLLVLAQG